MEKYASEALISFEVASWDIYHLLDTHDELINAKAERKKEKADVLVRSTYLFITACWESYVEDLCKEALAHLLKKNVRSRNKAISVLSKPGETLIKRLHTPTPENINNLFSTVIGTNNLANSWKWSGITERQAQTDLKRYIKIRGAIAHRRQTSKSISRERSEGYLDFIKILVDKTENHVQDYMKGITGTNFGKLK